MLFRKIGNLLATEVKWGRIAGLAAGAALIAVAATGTSFSMAALVVFSLAGIFIERMAPRHPYLNSFLYSLFGVLFYSGLFLLKVLGEGGQGISPPEFLAQWLQVAVVVVPQSLVGTWIGVTIRKFSRAAAESREGGAEPAPHQGPGPAPGAGKKGAPSPQRKPGAPRQASAPRSKRKGR